MTIRPPRPFCELGKHLGQQRGRTQIGIEMGGPALSGEIIEIVMNESRRIVSPTAPGGGIIAQRRTNCPGGISLGKVRHNNPAAAHFSGQHLGVSEGVVTMDQYIPAVFDQRVHKSRADAARSAGHDCRSWGGKFESHARTG